MTDIDDDDGDFVIVVSPLSTKISDDKPFGMPVKVASAIRQLECWNASPRHSRSISQNSLRSPRLSADRPMDTVLLD